MHFVYLLAQQAHEVAGCVGVNTKRRDEDVCGSMSPVLVVILHPVQHCMSHCDLCMDHLTWRERAREGKGRMKMIFIIMATICILVFFNRDGSHPAS